MRIVWEDERLEEVLADAEREHAEPDVPVDPFIIDEDWRAVVSADRVIINMVQRRADAEYHGFEILRPVELSLADTDEYDLVEVDADTDADPQQREYRRLASKRSLQKRLKRLEAQREMQRTAKESFDGEVDEVVVDAII